MLRRIKGNAGLWLGISLVLLLGAPAHGTGQEDLDLLTRDLGISLWDQSYSVRTGVGYKDNVLLDETQTKASPFFVNGLDVTIFKLPLDAWEYDFLVSGDDVRYWRDVGVGSEDLWIAAAKLKGIFGSGWQTGLTASYAYAAQVLDLLTSEGLTGLTPTKVIGQSITLRPFLKRELGGDYSAELQLEGTRQYFTSPAFSYWRFGPRIILGRSYGSHSEISLSYAVLEQPYDSETQAASDGSDLPGTRLHYLTQKAELIWRHHWDKKGAWESTISLSYELNHDNGSGYFDYSRYGITPGLNYEDRGWKFTAAAGLQYNSYPMQTSFTDLTALHQTDLTVNLHLERTVLRWLKIFVEYEYEHAFSNESTEHYIINTVKGGTSWEF